MEDYYTSNKDNRDELISDLENEIYELNQQLPSEAIDQIFIRAEELYKDYNRFSIQESFTKIVLVGHEYIPYEADHETKIIEVDKL